jgi:hypothetical protein
MYLWVSKRIAICCPSPRARAFLNTSSMENADEVVKLCSSMEPSRTSLFNISRIIGQSETDLQISHRPGQAGRNRPLWPL